MWQHIAVYSCVAAAALYLGRYIFDSVRAIGLWLAHRGVAQVSTNVEDPGATSLAAVIAAVQRHATAARAELVGLAPRAAFADFPDDVPVANKRLIEDVLADSGRRAG